MATRCVYNCYIYTSTRSFSLSNQLNGKHNFRKFPLHNFRGTEAFRKKQQTDPYPDIPVYTYGVKPTGFKVDGRFKEIPEMIPELIVPDLTDFKLKPYVSYRAQNVVQSEFTSRDLFNAVYSEKIKNDVEKNKVDEEGNPLEPSRAEELTAEEAKKLARQTGSDIFG